MPSKREKNRILGAEKTKAKPAAKENNKNNKVNKSAKTKTANDISTAAAATAAAATAAAATAAAAAATAATASKTAAVADDDIVEVAIDAVAVVDETKRAEEEVATAATTAPAPAASTAANTKTLRSNSDEVIEEFDFSDSDLRALSDEEGEQAKVDVLVELREEEKTKAYVETKPVNQSALASIAAQNMQSNVNKVGGNGENNRISTSVSTSDRNDSHTDASDKNDTATTTATTLDKKQTRAESGDSEPQEEPQLVLQKSETTKDIEKEKAPVAGAGAEATVANVIEEFATKKVTPGEDGGDGVDDGIDRADNDNNNNGINAAVEAKCKKATPPANLELKTDANVAASHAEQLPYCPITPRRIVDTADDDDCIDAYDKRLQTPTPKRQLTATNVANNDGDYDDGYAEDEPEDELLVQFLGEANRIAEARLAARRQARAEAREIRMRELQRQQKEQEQNADRVFDMHNAGGTGSDPLARSTRLASGVPTVVGSILNATRVVSASSMSSRRSSEDSLEEEGRSLRDIRHELKDVDERFRKAMIANAQLDNDRASQTFEVKLLKDKIEAMQESYAQLEREFKEKSRDYNALKRNLDRLTLELKLVQGQLNERDTLIAEQGLVIVAIENADGTDAKRALVSMENANVLASVQGSLDVRLKKFNEDKQQLISEVQKLQEQLEATKSEGKGHGNSLNGPLGSDEDYEAQREANKIISDYKYKLQKAEHEIASLQASLARSETQVIRYKSTAEVAEKAEAELKVERRKLQRENREAMERLEELETSNNHLLKRLDKLKNAKSALLKDL